MKMISFNAQLGLFIEIYMYELFPAKRCLDIVCENTKDPMILCGTGKNERKFLLLIYAFVGPTVTQIALANVKIVLTKSYTQV